MAKRLGNEGVAVAVLAVMASVPARAQAPAPLPQAAVGDTFTYRSTFATVRCPTWRITSLDQDGMVVSQCGDDTAYMLRSTGGLVRITGRGGKDLVRFTPASTGLQFPLALGKSWTGAYTGYTADDGISFESRQSCKVTAWETIDTAAGALPSYRVDCEDRWQAGPFSGINHLASWYAPQAHTVVRTRSDGDVKWNSDLVSYSVH